ncbi:MAG: FHA domain-containing protein, partial [Anaerolineae bacterium]
APLYPLRQTDAFAPSGTPLPAGMMPAVILEVLAGAHQFRLKGDELPVVIGRADAGLAVPGIDLAPYGGLERGVSRQHARLIWREGVLMVEDLASTNGTWVHDVRLPPNVPHPLKDGDSLRLGSMRLRVHIRAGE